MNIKSNLKRAWLTIGIAAMSLTILLWFGYDSPNVLIAVHVLDALMLVLSLPCSVFVVPVAALANYYLEINPLSIEGAYLATIFLFAVGLMQWFWLARFWSPTEPPFQRLDLLDAAD